MFEYEYEKRPASARSDESRATSADWARSYPPTSADWARSCPSAGRVQPSVERARRPLPPRPIMCEQIPIKTTVPLRVWVVAGASCLCVCAVLVLGTLALTRPPPPPPRYDTRLYSHAKPIYTKYPQPPIDDEQSSEEMDNEIANIAILEKLSLFKNMVGNRDRNNDLLNKPQIHPLHDPTYHPARKIEKKDKAKLPETIKDIDLTTVDINENKEIVNEFNFPEFKPLLPEIVRDIRLPENYINNLNNKDYEEYYNDENLYDDYMQSNTMTSYLIEKVQELHDWITKDPDFEINTNNNNTTKTGNKTEFSQLLQALNESLLEGNVSIVMNKLKDLYFDDNNGNSSRRPVILTNSTDLVSFGILTLDVMLLHNIQLMAWESQEATRVKMLKDPDVFAFNALFMEPAAARDNIHDTHDITHAAPAPKRVRAQTPSVWESALEGALGAARAAIHLARAYRNARNILSQLRSGSGQSPVPTLTRRDDNSHALQHLQAFSDSDRSRADTDTDSTHFDSDRSRGDIDAPAYSELDCVWLLYCRNLAATAKLGPPYGTMARINGMALRLGVGGAGGAGGAGGSLPALLRAALAGWSELDCTRMFPRCSKANAASVVLEAILQPAKKQQPANRGR